VSFDEKIGDPENDTRQHADTEDMSNGFSHIWDDQQLSECPVEKCSHKHAEPHPEDFDP
jgi:hypothetical protein